jgi:hypothetical protein
MNHSDKVSRNIASMYSKHCNASIVDEMVISRNPQTHNFRAGGKRKKQKNKNKKKSFKIPTLTHVTFLRKYGKSNHIVDTF